jgi:hypothetical protein
MGENTQRLLKVVLSGIAIVAFLCFIIEIFGCND